ncbi:hypothetical protein EVAR_36330_1 [Eumeta japonica]|uniref:Uncharacterized protein n=1 Tax=Eumeta variegata TaxID=151549 RepID=A0A4C1VJB3_EUMVA|nr:hypothetical protein EVAR_36330_1 [Eumeta japonica]
MKVSFRHERIKSEDCLVLYERGRNGYFTDKETIVSEIAVSDTKNLKTYVRHASPPTHYSTLARAYAARLVTCVAQPHAVVELTLKLRQFILTPHQLDARKRLHGEEYEGRTIAEKLHHENGPTRAIKYQTLTEYRREVPAFAVVHSTFITPLDPPPVYSAPPRYPIAIQEVRNALVTPLRLRMSMGDGDHMLFGGSHVCLPLGLL